MGPVDETDRESNVARGIELSVSRERRAGMELFSKSGHGTGDFGRISPTHNYEKLRSMVVGPAFVHQFVGLITQGFGT
jgi:hypothetical protein